jgi:type VII secretion protein EccE
MTTAGTTKPVTAPGDFSRGRPGTAILLPRRRPGYLGPVHLMQLVLAEAVLVAILAAVTRGAVTAAVAVLAGVPMLALTFARLRGRWWMEREFMVRRYRARRRAAERAVGAPDGRLAALQPLAPGLTVENVQVAGGGQVAVARDSAGWFAAAVLLSNTPMRDSSGPLPLDALAYALAEAGQAGAVLQVVVQAVPAPASGPASAAAYSYRQLLARFNHASVPAQRTTWVCVRLDARTLAEALADHTVSVESAPAVVAALIRRVTKALRPYGIGTRILDADALLTALLTSCDLDPSGYQAEARSSHEEWTTWRSSRFIHRCFWIRNWPPVSRAGALLDWFFTVPTAMTSVAITLAPEPGEPMVDLKGLVRVAAAAADVQQACLALTRGARSANAELLPLDGEQSPAVYASAPTGGGAR